MTPSETPADPHDVERRFTAMLDEAGLPLFDSTFRDAKSHELQLSWDNGLTIHIDLTRDGDLGPIDEEEQSAILGLPLACGCEPIHVTVPGSPHDPRTDAAILGVVIHRGPSLHPDDVTVHLGVPLTSPSRTLIDLAEDLTTHELRQAFARARELGLLDPDALRASRQRVEWRPRLAMLDEVIAEFCD